MRWLEFLYSRENPGTTHGVALVKREHNLDRGGPAPLKGSSSPTQGDLAAFEILRLPARPDGGGARPGFARRPDSQHLTKLKPSHSFLYLMPKTYNLDSTLAQARARADFHVTCALF